MRSSNPVGQIQFWLQSHCVFQKTFQRAPASIAFYIISTFLEVLCGHCNKGDVGVHNLLVSLEKDPISLPACSQVGQVWKQKADEIAFPFFSLVIMDVFLLYLTEDPSAQLVTKPSRLLVSFFLYLYSLSSLSLN